MKKLLMGIAYGVGLAGFLLAGGWVLLLLVGTPALCGVIYEKTPAYKRRHKAREEEFQKVMGYVSRLRAVRANPTVQALRELVRDGFESNIDCIAERNPLVFKITYDEYLI